MINPSHPAIANTPPKSLNNETTKLLQAGGIRVLAYGIHSKPRRIWLSMDTQSVIWQSEYLKNVPNTATGRTTSISMRGPIHRIYWKNIEYIDVGKRTGVFKHHQSIKTPHSKNASSSVDNHHLCFSILTAEGSLDLQANSELERDTVVSSLSMKLDESIENQLQYSSSKEDEGVERGQQIDWRQIYYTEADAGLGNDGSDNGSDNETTNGTDVGRTSSSSITNSSAYMDSTYNWVGQQTYPHPYYQSQDAENDEPSSSVTFNTLDSFSTLSTLEGRQYFDKQPDLMSFEV